MWVTRANSWVCERDVIQYTHRGFGKCENRVYERRGRWLEKLGGRKMHWFSFVCFGFLTEIKCQKLRERKRREC